MIYNEFALFFMMNSTARPTTTPFTAMSADELAAHGIRDGILADLGCGTGDLIPFDAGPRQAMTSSASTVRRDAQRPAEKADGSWT